MSRRTRLEHRPPVLPRLLVVPYKSPLPGTKPEVIERRWMWNVEGKGGIVTANTKSEAKSRAKKQMGLSSRARFPKHGVITEITVESEPVVSRKAR